MFEFMLGFMIFWILFVIAWIVLIIVALVDMLKADRDSAWKILWLLVIIFIPIIGVILYFIIGKEQAKEKKRRR